MTAILTPKQKEVLRLLAGHRTSKEIARAVGISPSAANQRIAAACRRLGLANRREAARFYSEDALALRATEVT
jgi:DNA-binding CsgD family transcriptional regulator